MTTVQIGTVSEGTLRDEDLLDAFASELSRLTNDTHPLLADYSTVDADDPDASDLVNEMQDALSELAPPHVYFGTLEGDGACFGFWPEVGGWDCEHVGERYFPNGEHEYVDLDCNVYVHVNDHGNVTVSATKVVADGTGEYRIEAGNVIWAAV
tara:strand:+ start:400 stop:858 length:459 start_codon:yes stop_codon:yes gene_type:complete